MWCFLKDTLTRSWGMRDVGRVPPKPTYSDYKRMQSDLAKAQKQVDSTLEVASEDKDRAKARLDGVDKLLQNDSVRDIDGELAPLKKAGQDILSDNQKVRERAVKSVENIIKAQTERVNDILRKLVDAKDINIGTLEDIANDHHAPLDVLRTVWDKGNEDIRLAVIENIKNRLANTKGDEQKDEHQKVVMHFQNSFLNTPGPLCTTRKIDQLSERLQAAVREAMDNIPTK